MIYEETQKIIELRKLFEDAQEEENEVLMKLWQDTLDAVCGEFSEKVKIISEEIEEYNAGADAIYQKIREMIQRRTQKLESAERLKKLLIFEMNQAQVKKVDTGYSVVSVRKSPPSLKIEDEEKLIEWAKRNGKDDILKYSEPTIDKTALKSKVKNLESFPGVTLQSGEYLSIK